MIQHLLDGILVGSILSLRSYWIDLGDAHAAIRQFFPCGTALSRCLRSIGFRWNLRGAIPQIRSTLDPLSLTWSLILAILFAMIVTGLSAILIDKLVFRRIREKGEELSMVFASFGIAMVVRNLISLFFGLKSQLFSNDIAFAIVISRDPMILVKPDQVFVLIALFW